jgi:hypothetical protein
LRGGYSGRENIVFYEMNYFFDSFDSFDFDYAVFSQTFNDPYSDQINNMPLIRESIGHTYQKAKKGVSFNFVTDKVQYKNEGVAYHNPEEVMQFAYGLSNCVFMDNGCMPYECTCTILKDKASDGLVYDSYKEKYKEEFVQNIFVAKPKHKRC